MQLNNILYQSPLNYTGGKYKLLPQILPLFPNNIDTFVDLFCGGATVGCNVNCNHVIFNDIDQLLIYLLREFKSNDYQTIIKEIETIIDEYGFSVVSQNGYAFYNCRSDKGLGTFNKEPYLKLRNNFNSRKEISFEYLIKFYVLVIFSFNNQIRYNAKEEFNLPVGKRDFNVSMQKKLKNFIEKLHHITCEFSCIDFELFNFQPLTSNDFVYADPPYLITCATYNEQGRWNETKELHLLRVLDDLNRKNIRFALSNVLSSKGKTNNILAEWIEKNPKYKCIHLNYNYSNSNYQTKDRTTKSDEVLVINY